MTCLNCGRVAPRMFACMGETRCIGGAHLCACCIDEHAQRAHPGEQRYAVACCRESVAAAHAGGERFLRELDGARP